LEVLGQKAAVTIRLELPLAGNRGLTLKEIFDLFDPPLSTRLIRAVLICLQNSNEVTSNVDEVESAEDETSFRYTTPLAARSGLAPVRSAPGRTPAEPTADKTANPITQELHTRRRKAYRKGQKRTQTRGEFQRGPDWRPEAESNRCTRICSPLHNHSAIRPARASSI
jgi:hypothetical protein